MSELIVLLDQLLASYHPTPDGATSAQSGEPPQRDWKILYDQTCKRFPDLGLYPIANPLEEGPGSVMMGDAIDDIADITSDLRDVMWYAEHYGPETADAHFKKLYFHWGTHARELLLLLHAKQIS